MLTILQIEIFINLNLLEFLEPGSESTPTLRTQPSQAPPLTQTTPPSVSCPLRAEEGSGSGSGPTVARKKAKKRTGRSALGTQYE